MVNQNDIKSRVFEKIRSGKVHMRPRAYFVAHIILIALLVVVALALSIFVLSFVIFSVHESGEHFLLGFGRRGAWTFFSIFLWATLVLDMFLFVLIEWFLRYFKFGYRVPILRIFVGILVFVFIGSSIVNLTPLHSLLLEKSDQRELPVLGEWYETIRASHAGHGVFRGTITSIQGVNFIISHNDADYDADDGTWTITTPSGFDIASLRVGDKVYVAGDATQGVIQAYGIKKLRGDR